MSPNLMEFLKVLTIVITWTACLTLGRSYILSIEDDEQSEEADDMLEHEKEA
tara:strand:+ start:3604 stop:3759 length:156 start_codon:yes stop_codon:yes gene_type:complete